MKLDIAPIYRILVTLYFLETDSIVGHVDNQKESKLFLLRW